MMHDSKSRERNFGYASNFFWSNLYDRTLCQDNLPSITCLVASAHESVRRAIINIDGSWSYIRVQIIPKSAAARVQYSRSYDSRYGVSLNDDRHPYDLQRRIQSRSLGCR